MRNLVLISLLALVGLSFTFGQKRSENGRFINYSVVSSQSITLPYAKTGFFIRNIGSNAVNVVLKKASYVATDNIAASSWMDYYPNCFSRINGDAITLNVSAGATDVLIETYEVNE